MTAKDRRPQFRRYGERPRYIPAHVKKAAKLQGTLDDHMAQMTNAAVVLAKLEADLIAQGWTRDAVGLVSPDGKSRMDP